MQVSTFTLNSILYSRSYPHLHLHASPRTVTLTLTSTIAHHHEQACHLPFATDGVPVIGGVGGVRGAFVATGAGCGGILMGPMTGMAMAVTVDIYWFITAPNLTVWRRASQNPT